MDIRLHPSAQNDLNEALKYYSDIDIKLRKSFINNLDLTFSKILRFPNLY